MSRREGGREVAWIEDRVVTSIRGHEDCIKKSKERLIKATRNNTNNPMINRTRITTN